MKASQKIHKLKRDITELFGPDDAAVRALEIREWYCRIGQEFDRLRGCGYQYQAAIDRVCIVFYCSESTARRAVKFHSTFTTLNVTK